MAGLPLDDWQFYVVTAAGLAAAWLVIRPLLPRRGALPSCPNCADASPRRRRTRTALTHEGKRV